MLVEGLKQQRKQLSLMAMQSQAGQMRAFESTESLAREGPDIIYRALLFLRTMSSLNSYLGQPAGFPPYPRLAWTRGPFLGLRSRYRLWDQHPETYFLLRYVETPSQPGFAQSRIDSNISQSL